MTPVARWLVLCVLGVAANAAFATTFQFRNGDGAGEGLNDSTPFTPEGGNNATTLGEARLNVLNEAARIWSALLTSSVPIIVDASVDPLTCTAGSATLAGAGATFNYRDFTGAPRPNVFYPSALADALSGTNISEGSPASAGSADLRVIINLTLHNNAGCFGGQRFYYGFDHNNGSQPDLLQVLLHEIAHGLGFSTRVDLTTGNGLVGQDGIERFNSYDQFIIDEFLNQSWTSLTAPQRLQSATRSGFLAWTGASTNAWRNRFAGGATVNNRLQLYAPPAIAAGSSVSHFDTAMSPNVLMEPFRTNTTSNFTDVTPCVLKDIGWTVTRCIDAANVVPVAQAQTVSVLEDSSVNIMLAGTDSDNDPLTFAITNGTNRGTLGALSTIGPVTTLFTPAQNANGADSFTFTVNDGAATSTAATVTISIVPVNDIPAAVPKTATVQSGKPVGITLGGTDIDGDVLAFQLVAGPASGTVTGTPPNVSYRSNDGFVGVDSFTYRVEDTLSVSSVATVSITVTAPPKSGGGSAGLLFLAMLAVLLACTRIRAARSVICQCR